MKILVILLSFMWVIGIIKGGGTTEERRRAVSVFALRHQDLPRQLLRLIASNGHVTRDCEQLEMGFFPQNGWKTLKRFFKRNRRTAAIRHVIVQYDDARAAWEKSPKFEDRDWDEKDCWWREEAGCGKQGRFSIHFQCRMFHRAHMRQYGTKSHVGTKIYLNEDYEILEILTTRFDGEDIDDLSNLPPYLLSLKISYGDLLNFEFSKLPKGLKWLTHPGPDAESKLHVQSLPPLLETLQLRQFGNRRKEDPLEVDFHLPLPQGLKVRVPRMDGFVYHPEPAGIDKIETGRTWTTFEVKWNDGAQIHVIVQ